MARAIRTAVREVEARGGDWRAVIDGLRPMTADAWASLPLSDRRRFFRHLRAFWDVHRHRMAPEAARTVYALRRRGILRVHAGRLQSVRADQDGLVTAAWRERGSGRIVEVRVARVLDCATAAGLTEAESPLLARAEAAGLVRPDPLGLGIETGALGAAITAAGASDRLFAVGSLRRFERWESTAIPELRAQAAALASHLAQRQQVSHPDAAR
jgi:uncharacterized NAD(P)/FAD-binding protein YdhS